MNLIERGQAIADKARQIVRLNNGGFTVKSQSSDVIYAVIFVSDRWRCSCPDSQFRERDCKHILAVQNVLQTEKPMIEACTHCSSDQTIRRGKRRSGQRHSCHVCNRHFTLPINS